MRGSELGVFQIPNNQAVENSRYRGVEQHGSSSGS